MLNFVDLTPQEITEIDLSNLTADELRSLHYFVWAFYADEADLQRWRQEKLLPLLLDLPEEYDDEDDDESFN